MELTKTKLPSRIFITGTDTGVGKTLVSSILVKGLGASYWKPIQAGLDEETDTEWVQRNTGLPDAHFHPERYRLTKPLSPHLSARLDGIDINLCDFTMPEGQQGHLIIEGAGGIMVPINNDHFVAQMISLFNAPVILVARSGLGTINHTLLSLEKLHSLSVPVLGVVMNGEKNSENRKAVEKFGHVRVIAEIESLGYLTPGKLQTSYEQAFNL